MALNLVAAVRDIDAVLAALVDIKPMADYGVVGTYDTVQARRQKALEKAEESLLALRRDIVAASGVTPTSAPQPTLRHNERLCADCTTEHACRNRLDLPRPCWSADGVALPRGGQD